MRRLSWAMFALLALALVATPALAQQTTGNINGQIVDGQGAAVPGVTVTAKNIATGFTRADVSDAQGIYRLTALPVGTYDLTAELQGFQKVENKGIDVNVGQTLTVGMTLQLASVQETVTVTGESPLVETGASSVGGVVDVARIENMPLNGRQFANLAATIPGVTMGFHTDPTKSTQFSPQIGGGNGRDRHRPACDDVRVPRRRVGGLRDHPEPRRDGDAVRVHVQSRQVGPAQRHQRDHEDRVHGRRRLPDVAHEEMPILRRGNSGRGDQVQALRLVRECCSACRGWCRGRCAGRCCAGRST